MADKMNKLVFATKNKNKLEEVKHLLSESNMNLIGIKGEFNPEETGETFEENALIKAKAAAALMGMPAIADDSGLVVDALNGRPGVHSARYEQTDERRINKLLDELKAVPVGERTARFVCSVVIVSDKGEKLFSTTQTCEGEIIFAPSGSHGFGYDPIFYLPDENATMAELTLDEKNKVSHRSKAFRAAMDWFVRNYG